MKTRDPARIERILGLLRTIWTDTGHTDTRLGQLLFNACVSGAVPTAYFEAAYNVEDTEIEKGLEAYLAILNSPKPTPDATNELDAALRAIIEAQRAQWVQVMDPRVRTFLEWIRQRHFTLTVEAGYLDEEGKVSVLLTGFTGVIYGENHFPTYDEGLRTSATTFEEAILKMIAALKGGTLHYLATSRKSDEIPDFATEFKAQ